MQIDLAFPTGVAQLVERCHDMTEVPCSNQGPVNSSCPPCSSAGRALHRNAEVASSKLARGTSRFLHRLLVTRFNIVKYCY